MNATRTTPDALVSHSTRHPVSRVLRALANGLDAGRYEHLAGGVRVSDDGLRIVLVSDLRLLRKSSPPQAAEPGSTVSGSIRLCWIREGVPCEGPWVSPDMERYVRRACEGLNMMFGAGTHWVEVLVDK